MESLVPENASFVSPSLKTTFSDAVFSVRMKGGEGQTTLVSILLEHKSHPDKWAAVQLLAYLAEGYRRQVKNLRKQKKEGTPMPQALRPIIPFLFYQGGKPWAFPGLRGLFGAAHIPLLRYVPDFETIFTSLYEMEDDKIAGMGVAWLYAALLTQKYSHNPVALLERLAPILRTIQEAMDGNFFLSFSIYISRSMDIEPEDFKKIVEAMPPDTNPQTMDTLYDKLMAKGRAEGIEQGSELAKKEAILSGFRLGIPVQILSLMTGYSEEKVLHILREEKAYDE